MQALPIQPSISSTSNLSLSISLAREPMPRRLWSCLRLRIISLRSEMLLCTSHPMEKHSIQFPRFLGAFTCCITRAKGRRRLGYSLIASFSRSSSLAPSGAGRETVTWRASLAAACSVVVSERVSVALVLRVLTSILMVLGWLFTEPRLRTELPPSEMRPIRFSICLSLMAICVRWSVIFSSSVRMRYLVVEEACERDTMLRWDPVPERAGFKPWGECARCGARGRSEDVKSARTRACPSAPPRATRTGERSRDAMGVLRSLHCIESIPVDTLPGLKGGLLELLTSSSPTSPPVE
mmetsp:Transcript_621/g.1307  ORF Transcript_621/g.1307 Transcript_621/m.1307 type:complete len:295 (+) Transcript_621:378-1262(+)